MKQEEREEMGKMGREHIMKNYNYEKITKRWDEIFQNIYNELGSWETRKNYKSWTFSEVK